MPLPLSNLVIAALAVGGVATGVGTAAASASPATPPSVVAAQAEQQRLSADIADLTTTARHLRDSVRAKQRQAAEGHDAPVAPGTTTPTADTTGASSSGHDSPTTGPPAARWAGSDSPGAPPATGDGAVTPPTTSTTTTQPRHGDNSGSDDGGPND